MIIKIKMLDITTMSRVLHSDLVNYGYEKYRMNLFLNNSYISAAISIAPIVSRYMPLLPRKKNAKRANASVSWKIVK